MAVVFISLLLIPVIVINQHRKKLAKKWLRRLNQIASHYNCSITMHEYSRHFALGLDENRGLVFFISGSASDTDHLHADLSAIKKVMVIKTRINGDVQKDGIGQSEQISLQFIPLRAADAEIKFILFEASRDGLPSDEFRIAESWAVKLNEISGRFQFK